METAWTRSLGSSCLRGEDPKDRTRGRGDRELGAEQCAPGNPKGPRQVPSLWDCLWTDVTSVRLCAHRARGGARMSTQGLTAHVLPEWHPLSLNSTADQTRQPPAQKDRQKPSAQKNTENNRVHSYGDAQGKGKDGEASHALAGSSAGRDSWALPGSLRRGLGLGEGWGWG